MGSGILGTNLYSGHGFFGFDPTPNSSVVGTVRNMQNGNFTAAPDTNASQPSTPTAGQATYDDTPQVNGANDQAAQAAYNERVAAAQQAAQANAYVDSQIANLNDLLGRTDTSLNQGLEQLNSSYQGSVNQQNNQLAQANQDYSDKRVATNKDKLGAYNTINKNANNGYRSLSQIIGRASGTGSSAFQEALPDAIGKDIGSKRGEANTTYASNMGNIDTAQKKTELSFQQILQDLANQRQAQEQSLRTGVEQQKQSILSQQQALQAQRGNLAGAQALQPQIEGSRNAVDSFFQQFKPTYTAQQAAIAAPDLGKYNVDRSVVNAQNQGGNTANPYADILRKKLQEQAV